MASKAFRNVVSALALSEGVALKVSEVYRARKANKTVLKLCARLSRCCHEAHDAWDGELGTKDLLAVAERMVGVEHASFLNGQAEPGVYCGFALGILSDVCEHIKDPYRLGALDSVNRALLAMNKYFDADLKRHDWYAEAGKACDLWRKAAV